MSQHLFKFVIFSFFLLGCVSTNTLSPQAKVSKLSRLLLTLDKDAFRDKDISHAEATRLARDIFKKTESLRKTFKMTSPPHFHNLLVNVGFREKGLCHHWSDALYVYLSQKNYPSFAFHLMGANIGEYWFEHNALLVSSKEGIVEEGVIIDPWRVSGKLYFSKVKDDRAYDWIHRAKRGCRRE